MKTILVLSMLLFCLAACGEFFTGKKKSTITTDPVTKEQTVTTEYEDAPIEDWVKILGIVVPGLGVAGVAAARIARNAARARDGMLDANEEAIENVDWSKVNTAESFKILLNTAQNSHKDAKLLGNHFKKWKAKRNS